MMEGQGNLKHNLPSTPLPFNSFPVSSNNMGCTPGKGRVAKPGFVFVIPANGEIMIPPVSVCHHVSTIGQLFFPIFSLYKFQATCFERTNCSWGCVKNIHLMFVNRFPKSSCIGKSWDAFEH